MKKLTRTIYAPKHDPELDKWDGVDLFPKKTALAKEMLAQAGLPPELQNRIGKK